MKNKKVEKFETPSYEEQETILTYDMASKSWNVYSDVIKHVNIFRNIINKRKPYRIGKNKKNKVTMVNGEVDGKHYSITVRKKPIYSKEQKQIIAKRLAKGRKAK